MRVHWEIWFLVGVHEETICKGNASKGEPRQFADLSGGLAKKGGGVFERGLTTQCTLWLSDEGPFFSWSKFVLNPFHRNLHAFSFPWII